MHAGKRPMLWDDVSDQQHRDDDVHKPAVAGTFALLKNKTFLHSLLLRWCAMVWCGVRCSLTDGRTRR
jgi:hypothetical protein